MIASWPDETIQKMRDASALRRLKGPEFCGSPDQRLYEIYLQLEEIEHRMTRVSSQYHQLSLRLRDTPID